MKGTKAWTINTWIKNYIYIYTHFPCFPPAPALPTWSGLGARRSEQVRNIILLCNHTPGLSNESNFQMQAGQGSPKAGCKYALLKHNCTKSLLWKKLVERENSRFKKKINLGTSSNSKRKRKWPILRGFLINGIFSIATGTMTGSFSNFVQSK